MLLKTVLSVKSGLDAMIAFETVFERNSHSRAGSHTHLSKQFSVACGLPIFTTEANPRRLGTTALCEELGDC